MPHTIKPLGNNVLVGPLPWREVSLPREERRVIVPAKYNDPRQFKQYRVLAVGPGRLLKNGHRQPPEVSVGDYVLYSGDFDHKDLEDGRLLVDAKDLLAKWSPQP